MSHANSRLSRPDPGALYVLTDNDAGRLLKLTPVV